MRKLVTRLADGRELIYFDQDVGSGHEVVDSRQLEPIEVESEVRYDAILDEWVVIASHRQDRTFLPPAELCPLCPSRHGHLTEIPAADYEVVVFENRFPSLTSRQQPLEPDVAPLTPRRPGLGRCEVVCFSADHDAALSRLDPGRLRLIVDVWADRTQELSRLPYVEQVMPFENRGEQIGVTLSHPHGQIYAYPFVSPRLDRKLASARRHAEEGGGCLFCAVAAAERKARTRVVATTPGWIAFVPAAARWPYELHLYPDRHLPDLPALDERERDGLAAAIADALKRFDGLFGDPTPYVLACQQAPVHRDRELGHLHFELTTPRRAPDKLKFLAGSETGAGVFINDVLPEAAAKRLRESLNR